MWHKWKKKRTINYQEPKVWSRKCLFFPSTVITFLSKTTEVKFANIVDRSSHLARDIPTCLPFLCLYVARLGWTLRQIFNVTTVTDYCGWNPYWKPTKRQAGRQWHPFKWTLLKTPEAISCTTAVPGFLFPKEFPWHSCSFKRVQKDRQAHNLFWLECVQNQ